MKPTSLNKIVYLLAASVAHYPTLVTANSCATASLVSEIGDGPEVCGSSSDFEDFDNENNNLPIEIIGQSENEVSFKIHQSFYDGTIEKLALNYHRGPVDIACEVNDNVGAEWTSETYTAVCINGKASVKLYVHFCDKDESECDLCADPETKEDYFAFSFEIDCDGTCEEPTSAPTSGPTSAPTSGPTSAPTSAPTSGPTSSPTFTPTGDSGSKGDPHFKSWTGEHFEFHGQCDLILARDEDFSDGLGLEVQIRTKLVRYWSYIKRAAIRIGEDILEVEGSGDMEIKDPIYWFNFEQQRETHSIGGFPLKITKGYGSHHKHGFIIDLSSRYPGVKIVIGTMKEFVKVEFKNASSEAFGNAVGILGDFNTGKTFARDGVTLINDFNDLGNEWQIRPSDNMLFQDVSDPQFPKRCVLPEDPQGQRRRRLEESSVSVEQAEYVCASLADEVDRQECVYDIIATQDLDMVGAY